VYSSGMGKPPPGFEVVKELGFGERITDWSERFPFVAMVPLPFLLFTPMATRWGVSGVMAALEVSIPSEVVEFECEVHRLSCSVSVLSCEFSCFRRLSLVHCLLFS